MTITSTANALQAINQAVSGVNAAGAPTFANYTTLIGTDGKLKDSLLPAVMSWAERFTPQTYGVGSDGDTEYESLTDWGVWVFAARDHQSNFIAGMTAAMTLAQEFIETYMDMATYLYPDGQMILVAGQPTVYVNRVGTVAGEFANQELKTTFAGIVYHGFKLSLQTKEEGTL
jgi:hypothetical protein